MISVITFKIKTKGNYIKNDTIKNDTIKHDTIKHDTIKDDKEEITYTLGMSSPFDKNDRIFITDSVKLAKKLSYDNDDYKNALTSYDKFKQFVKESIEKNGITPIEDKEAIKSNINFNINFIKNVLFPKKSTFKIDKTEELKGLEEEIKINEEEIKKESIEKKELGKIEELKKREKILKEKAELEKEGNRYIINGISYIDGKYEKVPYTNVIGTNKIDSNYIAHIELTLKPIPIIAGLQFRIKTTKFKEAEKNEKYDSMPDPGFIFITPSVKLTMNDLHYSYINGDYKKLLTSYSDFNALVDYIATKQEIIDKRDPEYETKKKEVLNNNIKIIKNIFFPDKSKYSYRNQKFLIVKSKYLDNDYDEKSYAEYKITNNYKALSTSYQTLASNVKIVFITTLEFTFLDIPLGAEEPSQADFTRLSCGEKAKELENQFMYYFDVSLNLFEKPKQNIVLKSEIDKAKELEIKKKKEEEEKRKEEKIKEDIIRKNLEEKERFLYLKKRDDERKKKEEEELKKKQESELKVGGKKKSKKVGLYKFLKKNVTRKR